ncbi:MAG: hypothetical protein WBG71_05350 [Leeuwenhoekiella sp.]
MRNLILAFFLFAGIASAQTSTDTQNVQVNDTFVIGRSDMAKYSHINFPKANFIIKSGGIANYKKMAGTKVVVTKIEEDKNGTQTIQLRRVDGKSFFGVRSTVSANVQAALQDGELKTL